MPRLRPRLQVIQHDPKIKRKKKVVELGKDEGEEALRIRKFALGKIKLAKAADLINKHELALLSSDKDLQMELEEKESLFGYLGLDRFELADYSGLMEEEMDFHKDHLDQVNHYIRGAQAAYRLGRAVCMESCMAPLAAGGDHTELPLGVKLEHGEMVTITFMIKPEEVGSEGYGLATRALLARARDSGETCKWYAHVPLYRLMLFSRPGRDEKPLKPTSENSSR